MPSPHKPRHIAIFASGNGSNFERLTSYFASSPDVDIALLACNRPTAIVLERAKNWKIPSLVFDRQTFYHTPTVAQELASRHIDTLVLAGFLWLLPEAIIKEYPQQIINIHPALLPKYGGKGMYGHHVHEAVIAHQETESGITIHYVDEKYDEGQILFQARCAVNADDTPDSLAEKIHELEQTHFPIVLEQLWSKTGPEGPQKLRG